jgi:hypothetical protein
VDRHDELAAHVYTLGDGGATSGEALQEMRAGLRVEMRQEVGCALEELKSTVEQVEAALNEQHNQV